MPAKRKASVDLERTNLHLTMMRPRRTAKLGIGNFYGNSEFRGKESHVQQVAHKLGQQGITFQSVRGKTLAPEELLNAVFTTPPRIGFKICMLRVLKEVEAGEIITSTASSI